MKIFSKYLKSIAKSSVIECDEIITVLDIVSTKRTNTMATYVMSTASITCHSIKVRDCYILHTFAIIMQNENKLMPKQCKNGK